MSALRAFDQCAVVTLTGIGERNAGLERRVISPFDGVEALERPTRLRVVRARRWRRLCRALVGEAGPTDMLRTALRARIDLMSYQLEPALAVVRGLGSRVLIADEVGLGKTIQAGLIVAELIARGAADRVLVLAPAGLCEQWGEELRNRFHLDAALLDMREARRRASELPVGLNPWSTVPIAIASIEYVKRPEVLPAVLTCRWDIVIVDEAHTVAPKTERRVAVHALCALAPYAVLLTATPHSGDDEAFAALCGLGGHADDRLIVFRRSRQDAALGSKRRIHRLHVRPSAEELRMHATLARFTRAVRAEAGGRDADTWLALTVLHKRALSSAYALEQSILRRLATIDQLSEGGFQVALPLGDDGELDAPDEAPVWTAALFRDTEHERQLLNDVASAAALAGRRETKCCALIRLLARLHRRGERGIVFTEYRDTLLHLRSQVPFACAVLHGGLARDERRLALDDFAAGRLPFLLATDAAGEGLNLHHHCRVIVNLELPWNPIRLEQRAGRVDRIGQTRTTHAFHLIALDTAEMRILERLRWRVARARQTIDGPDPLGSRPDEEAVVSRLVIAGEAFPSSRPSLPPPATTFPAAGGELIHMIRLQEDGAVEHARLRRGRAVLIPNERPGFVSADEPAVAFVRRRAVRSVLASRLLVVVRSVYEDGVGRIVASHITALSVAVAPRVIRRTVRDQVAVLLRELSPPAAVAADQAHATWSGFCERHHRTFWESRMARERAIADGRRTHASTSFQPGLFDQRAQRAFEAEHDRQKALSDEMVRCLAAAERVASLVKREPSVVLILVP